MEYFVSIGGNDTNPGSQDQPFRTVGRGVDALQAGDVLNLRHGVYIGAVAITGKHGTAENPIVIRSYPGEHAYIDGSLPPFRRRGNEDWIPAGSVEGEYVSAMTFSEELVNRGAFLDRNPYTRLVTYSNLNDLRAENETFDKIVGGSDPRPGPAVTDQEGNPLGFRRPWVYMGPGLHFNAATRRIHIRLAHTHNNVPGVIDYDEETDPRQVPLAIAHHDMTTLRIGGCSHLRLEHLTIAFGGDNTIAIQAAQHLTFDHVRIRAATRGIRMGGPAENPTRDVVFAHCQFLGGIPTWMFRSDRTSGYHFREGGSLVQNNLGEKTSETLLLGNPNNTSIEIHHCEFLHGHNVFLEGQGVDFHHNWINNLQDDALALGFDGGASGAAAETKIHDNVISRALTGFGFGIGNQTTQWRIYRNLVDLRGRTRGFRPRQAGDVNVFRQGQFLTGTSQVDLFQNTVLTYDQREQASLLHYRSVGPHRRRSFNNLFAAVNPVPEADRPITFVPTPEHPGPTDGNLYHRTGHAATDPLRHLGYRFQGQDFPAGTFPGLAQLHASALFEQSRAQYPPGYEANSLLADPQFRSIEASGLPRDDDDLRPSDTSPALAAGIRLPDDLAALDPLQPATGNPDIGCFSADAEPPHVGADGCHSFPKTAAATTVQPRRLAGGAWKGVFLHEFLDGDPANLKAAPGELTVIPDGLVIKPTPEPAERGLLMAPGNRLLVYRFAQPLEDVIGIDLSADILYPFPDTEGEFVFPLVSLGSAMTLALGRIQTPAHIGQSLAARIVLNVDGSAVQFDGAVLPPFDLLQTTRFRARWHTNGQAHLYHEGVLRAYQPGLAAGRSLTINELVVGIPAEVPKFLPHYRIRRVYLKILRRDSAQKRFDGQVPIDTGCQTPTECVENVAALARDIDTRIRAFMTSVNSTLTTSWREGQATEPFSPQAIAAQSAAVDAAKAFGKYIESREQATADAFVQRIGDFADIMAVADPAGFAALITDVTQRAESLDPLCRRDLAPALNANAETLQPLARLLETAWQRTRTAGSGDPNG